MLRLELDARESLAAAAATRECEHEIDHRPAEAEQQPNRAGQIGDREVRSLRIASRFPRDDGFDRELGQCLEPRQDGEC
ncbi:MAG: hypothetical protein AUI89_07425 [Gemmatimonadetes bacterium 13_1_40CM_3_65_8]|nr:MAG: hypothetical protein AUH75_07240 [Gemmatimonadetes bacterium 13_1_40CM_4_65_7]OLD00115.1 MAG: hypothetical protein AUI89_07425 [Gemmatimonadetes bacterium 13_1_40CM_3_65_8]